MIVRYIFFFIFFNIIIKVVLGKFNSTLSSDVFESFDEYDPIVIGEELLRNYDELFSNLPFETTKLDDDLVEDSFLLAPELIRKYGYNCEIHTVQTEDGYVLEMHRIPKPGAQPVFLMHGLLDSSSTWVVMGPRKGLAYMLADLGYDVWMGNARGNRYSKNHQYFATSSKTFWDFCLHEIGKYDIPVFIDYVLAKTGFKKLQYIGHSQGSLTFWILCHEHPEYNDKILSMQALGPVAYIGGCKSPVIRFMALFLNTLTFLSKLIGLNEFLPNSKFIALFSQKFCNDQAITQVICENIIFLITGFNEPQMNTTMLPVVLGHTPAGASTRQLLHYAQLTRSKSFRQYDHGLIKNLRVYGSLKPPEYDISRTKVKVALHYSTNDWLATPQDVEKIYQRLSNPIGKFLVDGNFNHLDYVWGIDARPYLYEKVVKIMKLIERGEI